MGMAVRVAMPRWIVRVAMRTVRGAGVGMVVVAGHRTPEEGPVGV